MAANAVFHDQGCDLFFEIDFRFDSGAFPAAGKSRPRLAKNMLAKQTLVTIDRITV